MLCDAKPFFYLEKSGKLIKVFGTDIMKRKGEGRRSKMKRLLGYLKDYRCRTVIAPLFKCLEACFELLVPLVVMLCVTFTALVERCIALVKAYNAGTAVFMVEGLQLIIAVLLMVLGVIIVVHSGKVLFSKSTASMAENNKKSEMNKPAHC